MSNFTEELPARFKSWADFLGYVKEIGSLEVDFIYQVYEYQLADDQKQELVKRIKISTIVENYLTEKSKN